jgi:hypothetical protein
VVFLLAMAAALAAVGWRRLSLVHLGFDDEGLFVQTVRQFQDGQAPYETFPTPYGPAFYLVYGGIASALIGPMTHDLIRVLSVAAAAVGCLLLGLAALRMTGRLSVASAALAGSFAAGHSLYDQPGHPAALAFLATAAATWAVAALPPLPAGLLAGSATALALATKTNVGLLFGVGLGAWALALMPRGLGWSAARLAWGAAAAAAPALLIGRATVMPPYFDYCLAATAAVSAAALIALAPPRSDGTPPAPTDRPSWWLPWAASGSGSAATLAAIVAATWACGVTADGVAEFAATVRAQATRVMYSRPPSLSAWMAVSLWGPVSLAAAVLAGPLSRRLPATARFAAAAASVAAVVVGGAEFWSGLTHWSGARIEATVAAMFCWLPALPPADPSAPAAGRDRAARALLSTAAAAQLLIGYPIAYAQWDHAQVFAVVALCVTAGDLPARLRAAGEALRGLDPSTFEGRWWLWARGRLAGLLEGCRVSPSALASAARRTAPALSTAAALAPAFWAAALGGRDALDWVRAGEFLAAGGHARPLWLEGFSSARLAETNLALHEWAALTARAHADSVLTAPGCYSRCVWAGRPSATALNWSPWPFLFDARRQAAVLADIHAAERAGRLLCFRAPAAWALWGGGLDDDQIDGVAARYVLDGMRPVASATDGLEEVDVLVPPAAADGRPVPRICGAEWLTRPPSSSPSPPRPGSAPPGPARVRVTLPILPGVRVAAAELVAWTPNGRSRPLLGVPGVLIGERRSWPLRPAGGFPAGGLDLSEAAGFDSEADVPPRLPAGTAFLVRCLGPDGEPVLRLPMVRRFGTSTPQGDR